MKTHYTTISKTYFRSVSCIFIFILMMNAACKKSDMNSSSVTASANYSQTNLVSDNSGINATHTDVNLVNPWGIAIDSGGYFWIAANHSGNALVYNNYGTQVTNNVSIKKGTLGVASPSGVVFNTTSDFGIVDNGPSSMIFATEDGFITAWSMSTGNATMIVADRSAANAVYKGIALAVDNNSNYLYAADFHNARIDVFDKNFALVTKTFSDPNIPSGFAPFNIRNINGMLYVTYAMQKGPDNMDDQSGAGNGYVDVFMPSGALVKRFASQGTLNSPWGMAAAPTSFGQGTGAILIGNFGDGHINIFDASGNYKGQLMNGSSIVTISGLWDIAFNNIMGDPNQLYFTSGPDSENHGLFGYLKRM